MKWRHNAPLLAIVPWLIFGWWLWWFDRLDLARRVGRTLIASNRPDLTTGWGIVCLGTALALGAPTFADKSIARLCISALGLGAAAGSLLNWLLGDVEGFAVFAAALIFYPLVLAAGAFSLVIICVNVVRLRDPFRRLHAQGLVSSIFVFWSSAVAGWGFVSLERWYSRLHR